MNTDQQQAIQFLREFFLPQNEKEELEVAAHSLAGAFLVKIESALEQKQMTKKELAKKIGTSASYLSQIFYSKVLLNFKTLAKIEKALDLEFTVTIKENLNNEKLEKTIDYSYVNFINKKKQNKKTARTKFKKAKINL